MFSVPSPCCSVFHPNVIQFKTPAKLYEKHYWRRTEGKKGVSRLTASSLRTDDHVADVVLGGDVLQWWRYNLVAFQQTCQAQVIQRALYVASPEFLRC